MSTTIHDHELRDDEYEPPALTVLGSLHELTLGCVKSHGGSDGFTFLDPHLVCTSP